MEKAPTIRLGEEPRYTIADAASILRLSQATLRRWCLGAGRTPSPSAQPPVIEPDGEQPEGTFLSFFNLVEAGFLTAYRRVGVPMQRVRPALEYARSALKIPRPLLTERFRTDGQNLFREYSQQEDERRLLNLTDMGQWEWPTLIDEYLKDIDFDANGPVQLWLVGKHKPIVANPRVGFGFPVLVSSGVRTEAIFERFLADERSEQIAEDLGIKIEDVEDAIRWESTIGRKAA